MGVASNQVIRWSMGQHVCLTMQTLQPCKCKLCSLASDSKAVCVFLSLLARCFSKGFAACDERLCSLKCKDSKPGESVSHICFPNHCYNIMSTCVCLHFLQHACSHVFVCIFYKHVCSHVFVCSFYNMCAHMCLLAFSTTCVLTHSPKLCISASL